MIHPTERLTLSIRHVGVGLVRGSRLSRSPRVVVASVYAKSVEAVGTGGLCIVADEVGPQVGQAVLGGIALVDADVQDWCRCGGDCGHRESQEGCEGACGDHGGTECDAVWLNYPSRFFEERVKLSCAVSYTQI